MNAFALKAEIETISSGHRPDILLWFAEDQLDIWQISSGYLLLLTFELLGDCLKDPCVPG